MPNESISGAEVRQRRALRDQPFKGVRQCVRRRRLARRDGPALGLGVDRRGDLDFDLAIGYFPEIALLLAGRRCPRKRPCGKWLKTAGFWD